MEDSKKILIVDDEEIMCKMLRIELEHENYEVSTASNGEEGLELARIAKPDLIILDVMMPKLNGYQVCQKLKSDAEHQDIPIILLTAKGQEADKEIGKEVNADAYVTKPFESEVLLTEVDKLLNNK